MFGVLTVVFFLFNVLPGDPARMMLDQQEDSEQLENIRAKYGFDKPISTQYFYYLNDLSPISFHSNNEQDFTFFDTDKYRGNKLFSIGNKAIALKVPFLRDSFQRSGKRVGDIIGETLPNTVVLAISSIVIAMLLGVFLGVLSAVFQNSWFDKLATIIGTLGMSLPSFFSAILLAWLFGFVLSEYTGLNMTGTLYTVDDFGEGEYLSLKNLILPAITLGIRPLAVIIQLTRSSLLEVLSQDYIRTAKAKGLSYFTIVRKHALQNALNPVITAASGWFASMLAGAVFVEYIFGWNGLGREIVNALNTMDLPVVMGAVLVIALMFVFINLLVDVLYGVLDPRVRVN